MKTGVVIAQLLLIVSMLILTVQEIRTQHDIERLTHVISGR